MTQACVKLTHERALSPRIFLMFSPTFHAAGFLSTCAFPLVSCIGKSVPQWAPSVFLSAFPVYSIWVSWCIFRSRPLHQEFGGNSHPVFSCIYSSIPSRISLFPMHALAMSFNFWCVCSSLHQRFKCFSASSPVCSVLSHPRVPNRFPVVPIVRSLSFC